MIVDNADLMIHAAVDGLGLTSSCEEYVVPQIASGALVRVLESRPGTCISMSSRHPQKAVEARYEACRAFATMHAVAA